MALPLRLTLVAAALAAAGAAGFCAAQAGLSPGRSGLGLKPLEDAGAAIAELAASENLPSWQPRRSSDFTLYGGARDLPRLGAGPSEAYGGVTYALPRGWGSLLEAGYVQESLFAPRRYALTGQVHTTLRGEKTLSAGLKYRLYDADVALRSGAAGDSLSSSVYSLAPSRVPGAGPTQSYQVQFGYQHSAASSFELALGRDVETYTYSFDPAGSALRQLTFTGQHWLTPSWALSYDVLYVDPASTLRLQGLGLRLGVRYSF